MKPSIALEQGRSVIRALVHRHRARNPRVVGSAAMGPMAKAATDFPVDTFPDTTLFDLGGLLQWLGVEGCGRGADVANVEYIRCQRSYYL